jgi:Rod binding domain-containing protein
MVSLNTAAPTIQERAPSAEIVRQRQGDFSAMLGRASAQTEEIAPEERARKSAEQFVALTFVQPLLKQLRESNAAAAPFAPTQGEKQFQGLIDADIAQKLVSKSNFPLVERLTSDLLKAKSRLPGSESEKQI